MHSFPDVMTDANGEELMRILPSEDEFLVLQTVFRFSSSTILNHLIRRLVFSSSCSQIFVLQEWSNSFFEPTYLLVCPKKVQGL